MPTSVLDTPGLTANVYLPRDGSSTPAVSEIGGKAHSLWVLHGMGLLTPPWIVIPTSAFEAIVMRGRPWPVNEEEAEAIAAECLNLELPVQFPCDVIKALDEVGLVPGLVAVRSSAAAEDGAEASYAGQFDSILGVRSIADEVFDAIRRVWSSAFGFRARRYAARARNGEAASLRMAVLVQAMVDPVASGVAFSADPLNGARDVAVVSGIWGLSDGLVSRDQPADTWRVRTGSAEILSREIVPKEYASCLTMLGVGAQLLPDLERDAPCLSDEQVQGVATTVAALADSLGSPQDVEWAIGTVGDDAPRLWILQTRPITALPTPPVAAGERRVWDNSNIVESYAGVTTPLTFSFARGVYEEVYRQFCRLMGVSEALLEAHRPVFAEMLGLINGRVYYNLLNWYRALALLPGYSVNRAFMERMMGVRQKLSDPPEAPYVAGKFEDSVRLARMVLRLVRLNRRLPSDVTAFHRRLDAALLPLAGEDLTQRTPDELLALYRRLEHDLLRRWQTPLVNDFLTMINFGILGRMVENWLPDLPPSIANDLLCGEGGIISAEPAKRVAELARQAPRSPAVMRLFEAEPDDRIVWEALGTEPSYRDFHRAVCEYLATFGDRCANELKLETVTLTEDPAFLIRMIRQSALRSDASTRPEASEQRVRKEAEALVQQHLSGLRRALFKRALQATRERVRDRENLRFERTRVFGVVRRIFLELGVRLAAAGTLAAPRDVFFLTQEEIFGHLTGAGNTSDLRALVTLRQTEFTRYREMAAPPDRFETLGPPEFTARVGPSDEGRTGDLQGTGCCPGMVRGRVAIVREPESAPDLTGRILVAERTDPGWTLLFPTAAGLLVQRGSLLSHSAIVARETGLPCIVGVVGLLETLREGEWVEMDGASGIVRRLGDG